MKRVATVCSLFLGMGLLQWRPPASGRPGAASETVVAGQFGVVLPDSWSVYEQDQALTGSAPRNGMVIFSSRPLLQSGATAPDPALLPLVDSGELPSFFVDRRPVKDIACDKFSKTSAYWLGTDLKRDRIFGLGGRLFSMTAPRHTRITLAGCEAWRYEASPKDWILDVRAVSDGTVLYLFTLRNKRTFYEANLPVFEAAMASLRFLTPSDSTAAVPD